MEEQLRVRPLGLDDEAQAEAAHRELAAEGFEFLLDRDRSTGWSEYVRRTELTQLGIDLPGDRVAATFLVGLVGTDIVGRLSLRHELTPWLREFGGHIGYAVRPAFRRRGYATAMLQHGLQLAADDLSLDRVLVTCDDGNAASAAVIERCGGVLENVVAGAGAPKRRYWITTGR